MRENQIQLLGKVIKVDLVYEAPDRLLTPFFDMVAESPLMQSEVLRSVLRAGINAQTAAISAILPRCMRETGSCTWDPFAMRNFGGWRFARCIIILALTRRTFRSFPPLRSPKCATWCCL